MAKKHLKSLETKVEVIENEITKDGKVTTRIVDGAIAKGKEARKVTREEINKANVQQPEIEDKEI